MLSGIHVEHKKFMTESTGWHFNALKATFSIFTFSHELKAFFHSEIVLYLPYTHTHYLYFFFSSFFLKISNNYKCTHFDFPFVFCFIHVSFNFNLFLIRSPSLYVQKMNMLMPKWNKLYCRSFIWHSNASNIS